MAREFELITATAIDTRLMDSLKDKQEQTSNEIKALATRFALNEMMLNKWIGNEAQWQNVYATVWLEKELFVRNSYSIAEILDKSNQILAGQKKIITFQGIILQNTGEILKNQEIIITNQGLILDVTGQILDNTEEIKATSYEILGTVQDIQGSVNDIKANGVKVISNNYSGAGGFTSILSQYLPTIIGIFIALILLMVVLKIVKKKKS